MKFGFVLLWLLLALPGGAQEAAQPSPDPPESALEPLSLDPPLPEGDFTRLRPEPVVTPLESGLVPGISLKSGEEIGRTYSETSPFNIWGGDRTQRSNLFTAAGLVRRAVRDALHLPDEWYHPIIIQIRPPLAAGTSNRPPVWTTVSQVEGGFRIEITLVPRRGGVPGPLLQENLVRAILADLVLKGKEKLDLTGAPMPPPDWLLHGTLALMEYRQLGRMSQTFARVFRLGRVLSVPDILNAEPDGMDSISHTLYRVSCGALILMLVEQPKGPEQFTRLLTSLAFQETGHELLIERAFPALGGSSNSLSKWWSLQIAALSQPGLEEVLSPAETERLLAEALVLHYVRPAAVEKKPGAIKRLFTREKAAAGSPEAPLPEATRESCDIQEYARVQELPNSGGVFHQAALSLTRLMLRAHPVHRPIIQGYQDALQGLAKGKSPKGLTATLEQLASTRQRLATTLRGVEDHLDWFEATQVQEPSGEFEGYLRAAAELEAGRPPGTDPVSRYLDQIEAEFGP